MPVGCSLPPRSAATWNRGRERHNTRRPSPRRMAKRSRRTRFLGFLLLVPLAIASTAGWIRRLGGRRWRILHRGIYFAVIAGVIHFYWKVKSDVRSPLFYGALVAILLLWRLSDWFSRRRSVVAAKLSPEGARVATAR